MVYSVPVITLTNKRFVPGSSSTMFIRAACGPAGATKSGSEANSTSLIVTTASSAGIGAVNGLLLRPGPDGTYGCAARPPGAPPPGPPGRPWGAPPGGACGAPGAAG